METLPLLILFDGYWGNLSVLDDFQVLRDIKPRLHPQGIGFIHIIGLAEHSVTNQCRLRYLVRVLTVPHLLFFAAPEGTSTLIEAVGLAGLIEHQLLLLFPRCRVVNHGGVVGVAALLLRGVVWLLLLELFAH